MGAQIKSNQQLDAAINGAQTASELREVMLSTLQQQGTLVRSRDDEFNNRLIRQPQTPDASLAASQFKYEREIHFAESTGKRSLLIKANTIEDLEALTRQVTGEMR